MFVNVYRSLPEPTVESTIPINKWFATISGHTHYDIIHEARKYSKEHPTYNRIKYSLPCVTYNFLFDKYKNDGNIIAPTGVMYIDVDDTSFNIDSINKNKIFSYYRSFGGRGWCIVVKVENLSKDNFKSTYEAVCNELNISNFIDANAIKATQFNVISYDENIYYNPDSYIFTSINNSAPPSMVYEKKERAYTLDRGAVIRYDDLDMVDIPDNMAYVVNWDGYDYVKCFIPFNKLKKNRNRFLLSYCANYVWLNPSLQKESVINTMNKVNTLSCEVPVDISQVERVVNSIFNQKEANTLQPIVSTKKKKIVFRKGLKIKKETKMEYVRHELSQRKIQDSKQRLFDIINEWDLTSMGKISQRKIYDNNPISKKTVEKYWSEFKDLVTEKNNQGLFI